MIRLAELRVWDSETDEMVLGATRLDLTEAMIRPFLVNQDLENPELAGYCYEVKKGFEKQIAEIFGVIPVDGDYEFSFSRRNEDYQQLKLANELFHGLHRRKQTSTIRFGHGRGIVEGALEFRSLDDTYTHVVVVTKITEITFGALTEEDARKNGFASLDELFEDMKVHYPDLETDSPVTVVEFRYL